ncbi:peptide-methionine (S)-S-oxide reductase MsrA [Halomonas sp. ANAO-440]|uniref:peptide-methionine (S)-S-oxide reductase MsrA n=1 Tax=Halomonas sp. ANAO-440 TaxID=2861360 RepID=UPI001CAA7881|nr:peptide-methionine (S)-S-oxide reductase MsrA [Halomonas sp. ANAO-440]MBZ0330607.1 peptide-methionine (S)-S-oxide reductase MsrA [Halomonas sp. ANAO-440]
MKMPLRFPWLIPALVPLAMASPALGDDAEATATAIFGGGCFWCVEEAFDKVEGVVATTSGFSGGHVENPTYEQVVGGGTGHAEVVKVEYEPDQVDYATLLHVFWRNIDPFAVDRQFCDQGEAYRSAIFYGSEVERELAESTRDELAERFERDIATEIASFESFYPAEEYHQDYYRKNPVRYQYYKAACGRERRLEEVWGAEAGGLGQP